MAGTETIKEIIDSVFTSDDRLVGYDIVIRSIKRPDKTVSANTLVRKEFLHREGKKMYIRDRGLTLRDLLIVKRNWNRILGAMLK